MILRPDHIKLSFCKNTLFGGERGIADYAIPLLILTNFILNNGEILLALFAESSYYFIQNSVKSIVIQTAAHL